MSAKQRKTSKGTPKRTHRKRFHHSEVKDPLGLYWTVAEAALALRVSEILIRKKLSSGELRHFKIGNGSRTVLLREDVLAQVREITK